MKKYLVFPGLVESKRDGDVHFIGAAKLMKLYGVAPHECIVIRGESDLRGICDPSTFIHLAPRYDGDYKLPA